MNHPYLVTHSNNASIDAVDYSQDESHICGLCKDAIPSQELCISSCSHSFCKECIISYLSNPGAHKNSNSANNEQLDANGLEINEGKQKKKRGSKKDSEADAESASCPVCDKLLTIDLDADWSGENAPKAKSNKKSNGIMKIAKGSLLSKINLDEFLSSTKLEALMEVRVLIFTSFSFPFAS